jgi:hypothetical protein
MPTIEHTLVLIFASAHHLAREAALPRDGVGKPRLTHGRSVARRCFYSVGPFAGFAEEPSFGVLLIWPSRRRQR